MERPSIVPEPMERLLATDSGRAVVIVVISLAFHVADFVGYYVSHSFFKSRMEGKELNKTCKAGAARFAGAAHNLVQIPLGLYCVLSQLRSGTQRLDFVTTESLMLLLVSAGFFLYDCVHCAKNVAIEGPAYLLHAVCCGGVYAHAAFRSIFHLYGAAFVLFELSTPFVYMRWFLFKTKATPTAQTLNALGLLVSFCLCRIVWGTYVLFLYASDVKDILLGTTPRDGYTPGLIVAYSCAGCALTALNYYWFSIMVSRALVVARGTKTQDVMKEKDA